MRPTPGTSSSCSTWPVGSSFPVMAPPGSRNSSRIGAPVPATPGIASEPDSTARPSRTSKVEWMILRVLVLWMRSVTGPSAANTMPSSTANGPMAELMLPQLPFMSTRTSLIGTCAKV